MPSVGSYVAKTHLPRLLKRVARGERITITRHGVPVARLVPIEDNKRPDIARTIAELRGFSRKHPLGGTTIRTLIEEGRRR